MQNEKIQGFRLSAQQEHLWAVLPPADVNRREAWCAVRIEGPLVTDALAAAVQVLVETHEILRTRFRFLAGVRFPLQVIGDASPVHLEEQDLRSLDEKEKAAAIERARAALAAPRDLADGAPLRLALLRLAPEERLLLLGLPALCCDEAGLRSLVRDLSLICAGTAVADLEPVQYVDVSEWHHDLLAGEEGALGREHWRDHRLPPAFTASLPGETTAAGSGGSVAAQRLAIPAETMRRLGELAERLGAEPRSILLAAWAALLGRLAEGEETVLGVACAGRRYDELKDVVGLLARHLPVRLPALPGLTFEELVARLEEQLGEAESWQEAFSWRDAAGAEAGEDPFLPFCFSFEEEPEPLPAGPAVFRILEQTSLFDRFLVKLSLVRGASGAVRGELLHDAGRLREAEAERLAERFLALLENAFGEPRRPVERLGLLGARERRHVLVELNDTATPLRQVPCIHHLFAEQAARRLEHPAVRCGDRSLTYGELAARAGELAASLRALGVGPDTIVGLFVERSVEMVVGILGVLEAGGAYLSLDPVYPADRLGFMIEDSGVRVLLTQSRLLDGLPPHRAAVVCIDGEERPAASGILGDDPDPRHLAYVIYTSGSTGRPKGVGVSHANLVHSTLARAVFYERPVESFLLLSSFAFDSSVAGIFWSLCQGGTLVLPDGGPQLDPEHVNELIAREGITHVLALPSLYALLLAQAGPRQLASLQTAIVAGESCSPELVERHHERLPGAVLCNEYGPTEGTVWSSAAVLPRELAAGRVSIGQPIANTRIYLLDREAELVPTVLAGELHIGGPGLARGYLGRPDLTAERFVPDPFAAEGGQRLYRTGDLARYLATGEIEFLGRIDHQVKIRGFRIELGEVEAALLRHPEIAETVVVAREDEPGDKRLVAYLVAQGSAAPDLAGLRDFLRSGLPEHMVPAAFVPLDELPRTPNGKVDRRNLPAPGDTRLRGRGELVAPRTPVEEVVAGIWGDLLGLEAVGAHDHFFELGGHSLLATRVVSRLREAFRIVLTLPDLFAAPRVEEMAARIEQALRTEERIVEPPLVRVDRSDRGAGLPLSFAQQRLWFLDQLEPGATIYIVPMAVRISGPLAVEALRRSLEEIVRRHEALRTTFAASEGPPRQVIAPEPELSFTVTDLRQMPEGERAERARRLAAEEIGLPFDLSRGPLLRITLFELGDADRVLLVTVHHIVSDLWSIGIFIRELTALYEAFSHDRPSPLPELPVQYADFAAWQRDWLQGEVLERQLAYWRDQLAGAPPVLDLPFDQMPTAVRTYRAGNLPFLFPPETASALRQMSRNSGATLFMTLLGLYKVLLGRYSGQRDVCVGVPIAGRTRLETEPLIGFFVNTLVMRCDQSGDPGFRDFLARVRQSSLSAYTHQELPFEILVEAMQPERELSRSPLFQVLFALQNAAVGELALGGLQIESLAFEEASGTPFDLSLSMRELSGGLVGSLEYSAELFEETTVRRLVGHFQNLVQGALAAPDRRLSELPLLSQEEIRQVLVEWNETATGHDRERTLQQLFERQAAATPEAVAVEFHDRRLTYHELNGRANRLAHHLISLGVGPEVRVGVLLERSPELIVALLGVLKAGGAYVPLDPAYPRERLDFMLADSGAPVLVVQPDLVPSLSRLPRVRQAVLEPGLEGFPDSREVDPEPRALPQSLALVIYTSGSTGVPKGVAIQHRSVAALLGWAGEVFPAADLAAVLASTSVCFDLSVFELFLPLCRGGRVVLLESVLHLAESPAAGRVTLVNTVPSAMAQLLELGVGLPAVRTVNLAGEPLRGDLVDRIYESTPARRVLNLYGPSEDTTYSTLAVVPPGCAVPSIGRPAGDTCAYLLDAELRLVPPGVSGELCLAGAGLARGYLGRPDLTAGRFVPDPFGSEPGGRLYRTGDLARHQPDGEIRFLRRMDHQVKIRGFRIELGEIEAALHRHPAVGEAVVVVREDRPGDRRLIAYAVADGAAPEGGELRTFLATTLPASMIPSEVVLLESMPRTPNGKLDRKALPAPGSARAERGAAETPPRNPVEERIAGIWAEVLGVDQVGIHESFFDLGGHSLLATQVVARLRRSFDVELPLRALFERPTVALLAELVEATRPAGVAMDKIAAMLAKIEQLSSEEARALLEEPGLLKG